MTLMTAPPDSGLLDVPFRGPAETSVALSPRQHAIFALLATGIGRREVAHRLGYSWQTVRLDIWAVYERLGTDSVLETLWKLGWVRPV